MITFGITGSISVGKSTVTRIFQDNNIPIVDADVIARQIVEPGSVALKNIVNCFGFEVIDESGQLLRPVLGSIVFNDPTKRQQLNNIMFPLISEKINMEIEQHHLVSRLVGLDSALIIESGDADNYRPLIVVHCEPELQIKRLMLRNNLTRSEAMARINSQLSQEEKLSFADFTIDTSGTIDQTKIIVVDIIKKLLTQSSKFNI